MLYIMESLSPGEHIIQPTGYHWIFVFHRFVSLVFFILAALAVVVIGAIYHKYPTLPPWQIMTAFKQMSFFEILGGFWSSHVLLRSGAFLLVIFGIFQLLIAMVIRATTEIAVTNRRLILKTGIIARNVKELKIENIEGINVHQSILGRLLNYGQMSANGTGVGEIHFPAYMADPVSFRRAIQAARTPVETVDVTRSSTAATAHDMHHDLAEATARHTHGRRDGVDI
jgi:uncharacterized membrane protein YdbT with pleckstrin-like domain